MGCVSTAEFPAVEKARLTPDIVKAGTTLAGIAGIARIAEGTGLAPSRPGDCDSDGALECVATAAFRAAATTGLSAKILSGKVVAGVAGTALARPAGCASDGALDCVATSEFRAAETTGLASKVVSGQMVAGVAGTAPARPAECASDGAVGCVVPSTGSLRAADTSNFSGWDLRKQRNPTTGAVVTVAGIAGMSKTCRNRANTQTLNGAGPNQGYNYTTAPAGAGLDVFDTVDDNNNTLTGLPGEIPAWSTLAGTDYGADHACGGIYATGALTTGATGADAALSHDPNGNWQDLTPNHVPGGTPADNTGGGNGCNHSSKHCVFRDLISGLMVTEVAATTYTWADAISYCDSLGESGVVPSPIPVIGGQSYTDWRLPTQKELYSLYSAGIRGLNQTSALRSNFGNVDINFWSSTTVSGNNANSWFLHLHHGGAGGNPKSTASRVFCVR